MTATSIGIQPALGGSFGAPLGHDTGRVRAMTKRNTEHFVGRRHLQVERQLDVGDQPFDIRVGHVPTVLAEMGGDAIRAGRCREAGGADGIRMRAATSVPDGRHVVDIYSQSKMSGHRRVR